MTDRERHAAPGSGERQSPHDPHHGRGPLGTLLLLGGTALCMAVTADGIKALPFDMPASWYVNKPLWLGVGVALLFGGFALLRPPPGDESDTR